MTHPDAALIAHEAELEALVLEWQQLDEAWPEGKTPMERWQIGRRHEAHLVRIRELHRDIAETEARTLAGAAVQLRRLRAVLDDESSVVEGLSGGCVESGRDGSLVSALEGGRLKVASGLAYGEALVRELQDFKVTITSAKHAAYGGASEHDDLVVAVALATFGRPNVVSWGLTGRRVDMAI